MLDSKVISIFENFKNKESGTNFEVQVLYIHIEIAVNVVMFCWLGVFNCIVECIF